MFKVGEVVLYSTSGVCRVSEITEKSFGSFSAKYYVLTPLMQKASTVFVPTQNDKLTKKMHPILSKNDYESVFSSVKENGFARTQTENERQQKFLEIIESGSREDLICMILDLREIEKEQTENSKRLHISDERLLNSLEGILFDELCFVFEIQREDANEFLINNL